MPENKSVSAGGASPSRRMVPLRSPSGRPDGRHHSGSAGPAVRRGPHPSLDSGFHCRAYSPPGGPSPWISGADRDIALLSRVGKPACVVVTDIRADEKGAPVALLSRRAAQERALDTFWKRWSPACGVTAVGDPSGALRGVFGYWLRHRRHAPSGADLRLPDLQPPGPLPRWGRRSWQP